MVVIGLFILSSGASVCRPPAMTFAPATLPDPPPDTHPASDVWLVERSGDSETWSNGLRIDDHFLVTTHPRSWLAFPASGGQPSRRSDPAGVVFHSTESQQLPFESDENRALKRIGESLLEYVQRRHAYNFVIDRFGRVYRVVPEDQTANHAGYSVWADENWFYVNLNAGFLGVAFEANGSEINPAQARSAAMLVEMLRKRYRIPASNFVTHAQVSVNPSNMRVGSHVDWVAGFPFGAIGLPDNYDTPLPAVWAFGFDCDGHFTGRAAASLRAGIERAETQVAERAAAAGLPIPVYKMRLRERYRAMLSDAKHGGPEAGEAE